MNLQDLGAADRMALFWWGFGGVRSRLGQLIVLADRLALKEEKQRVQAFILGVSSKCARTMPSPELARLLKEADGECRSNPLHYVCEHCRATDALLKITKEQPL